MFLSGLVKEVSIENEEGNEAELKAIEKQAKKDKELIIEDAETEADLCERCLLYTSPSPRDGLLSRMPSSA